MSESRVEKFCNELDSCPCTRCTRAAAFLRQQEAIRAELCASSLQQEKESQRINAVWIEKATKAEAELAGCRALLQIAYKEIKERGGDPQILKNLLAVLPVRERKEPNEHS